MCVESIDEITNLNVSLNYWTFFRQEKKTRRKFTNANKEFTHILTIIWGSKSLKEEEKIKEKKKKIEIKNDKMFFAFVKECKNISGKFKTEGSFFTNDRRLAIC